MSNQRKYAVAFAPATLKVSQSSSEVELCPLRLICFNILVLLWRAAPNVCGQ